MQGQFPEAQPVNGNLWAALVSSGDLVFDVGANLGDKTMALLAAGARVVCVEPQPACVAELKKRFAGNPQVTIVEKGLADKPGFLTLSICSEANYISTFSEEWKQGRFKERVWDKKVEVEIITLDQLIREHGKPKFCKVDVEGFELPVLQGLSSLIDFLSFEFAIEFLDKTRACLAHLSKLGYQQFNFSFGETQQFTFSEWRSAEELVAFFEKQPDKLFWGDIYAHSPHVTPPIQKLSGALWADDRIPVTNDDLLLELANREITQSIRCLFQIGAHRFEEYETIVELFPNLEQIILFEPNPELFQVLKEKFVRDNRIRVFPYALADRNGPAELFISNNDGHSSSLLQLGKHREIFPQVAYERSVRVEQITLPESIARHSLPLPDMLFIDAQGAECKILSALTSDLKERVKIIYVEASLEEVYQGAGTLDELQSRLHPEFKFAAYVPQNQYTPTHGNAVFINSRDYSLMRLRNKPARKATNSTLPIGVVIPTRNVRSTLAGHLQRVNAWVGLVEEIIVVDSQSTDGTVDFIQKNLTHPKLRIFSRPPGLYGAWNYGIQQIQSKYIYISTIGEEISREGLEHLVETAEKFQSDVVLSQPRFFDLDGKPIPGFRWPIHEIIQEMAIKEPTSLSSEQAIFYAIKFGAHSILGSSASNLYRTEVLQKNPFPTDFGHAGDTAWGIINAAQVRFTITPREFSSFSLDPKYQQASDDGFPTKVFWLSSRVATELLQANPEMLERNKKILQAIAEAGARMQHEGQPFQKQNAKLQAWAEGGEARLREERRVTQELLERALNAHHRLKRHWWVRLGKNTKIINMKKLENAS